MATESKPAEGIELDVPSTHQLYLESLLGEESKDRKPPVFKGGNVDPKDLHAVTKDGYVGTDPIYQNAANKTEKPLQAKSGPDKLAEDAYKAAVEGEPNEAGDQLKALYGDVSNTREEGSVIGGAPVKATVTPPPPVDNPNAGATSGMTGAPSDAPK